MLLLTHMRVLLLSLSIVVLCGILVFGARMWGLMIPHVPYDHDFLKGERPFIAVRVNSADDARKVLQQKPRAILWIDVPAPENGTIPLVDELLRAFPGAKFILNLPNLPDIDVRILKVLEPLAPEKRVLIQSDADVVIKALKRKNPLWVYGTSWSDLTKLMSFESVGLIPTASFGGDVFIAPMKMMGRPAFNAGVIEEMRRRYKIVLLGPLTTPAEVEAARAFEPDGYVLGDPSL